MSKTRIMDQVRNTVRALHYSRKTEHAYCYWIRSYIRFHNYRHPALMGADELSQYLTGDLLAPSPALSADVFAHVR